ncbi:hypothetical protein C5167_033499 [Papaver somniferum]|uniref:Uncharacterized protein n=1 Tax=Papaver somniferum TaxID=3469 RepID=A0A4Y7KAG7_PAPSO|nr:uncharacterized protein LOC113298520 [Papaver somniferum]RZC70374.1 hypothetical protein C5167_033499 [Papaver somniferum]
MWQLVVAAAVAGCGMYAQHFLKNVDQATKILVHEEENEFVDPEINESCDDQATKGIYEEENESVDPEISKTCDDPKSSGEQNMVVEKEKGIFRFSSLDPGGSRLGLLKKVGLRKNVGRVSKRRIKVEKYNTCVEEERNKGKKISLHLKKRRTNKNAQRKCGSFSSNGDPSFGWGIGLGIMCMISAGKAEINKMNEAIEETAKVVSNLNSVLSKRKLSRYHENAGYEKVNDGSSKVVEDKNKQPPEIL